MVRRVWCTDKERYSVQRTWQSSLSYKPLNGGITAVFWRCQNAAGPDPGEKHWGVAQGVPETRQTMLFSAAMPVWVKSLTCVGVWRRVCP